MGFDDFIKFVIKTSKLFYAMELKATYSEKNYLKNVESFNYKFHKDFKHHF